MKRFLKSLSIVLVICLAVSSFSGCRLFMDYQSDYSKYQVTEFKEMSYSKPDIERFYSLSQMIESSCNNFFKAISVNDYFTEMVDIYNSVCAMISLLSVYTSLDVTNKVYAEEYLTLKNEIISIERELNRISTILKDSKCAYMIEYYYGADVWDYFTIPSEDSISSELEKLLNEENELVAEYNQVVNSEFSVSADGIDGYEEVSSDDLLNEKELELLYYEGIINNEQYTELLRELYLQKNGQLGDIYVSLVSVRKEIAKEKGFDSFSQYAYSELYSREYVSSDFIAMRQYVKDEIVPLYNHLVANIDFNTLNEANAYMSEAYSKRLGKTVKPVLDSISEEMRVAFDEMYNNKMCSLYHSGKKADLSFTTYLSVYNKPYLFCKPSPNPTVSDFFALIHEFGHYYAYLTVPVTETNANDLDSHEVLSQGFELIVAEHMGDIFNDNDLANVAYLSVIIQLLGSVIEGCKMDEFQERVFALEDLTIDEINKVYGDIMYEYGSDFYDVGDGKSLSWIDIPHNFIAPFYYISYTVSAVSSFLIWSLDDRESVYFSFVYGTEDLLFLDNLEANDLEKPFSVDALKKIKNEIISRTEKVGVNYDV